MKKFIITLICSALLYGCDVADFLYVCGDADFKSVDADSYVLTHGNDPLNCGYVGEGHKVKFYYASTSGSIRVDFKGANKYTSWGSMPSIRYYPERDFHLNLGKELIQEWLPIVGKDDVVSLMKKSIRKCVGDFALAISRASIAKTFESDTIKNISCSIVSSNDLWMQQSGAISRLLWSKADESRVREEGGAYCKHYKMKCFLGSKELRTDTTVYFRY